MSDTICAIVQKIFPSGPHGPYAVATTESEWPKGSLTFSLEPTVWQEADWPEEGNFVLLSKLRQKRAGWRAKEARFCRPSDEQRAKNTTIVLPETYVVTVDHTKSLDWMKNAGNYNVINLDDDEFSMEEYFWPRNRKGIERVQISFFRFETLVTSGQVVGRMKRKVYRPINLPELFALGAQHPEVQLLGGDIVELGTKGKWGNELTVIYIGASGRNERTVGEDSRDQQWDNGVRFGGVPLQASSL